MGVEMAPADKDKKEKKDKDEKKEKKEKKEEKSEKKERKTLPKAETSGFDFWDSTAADPSTVVSYEPEAKDDGPEEKKLSGAERKQLAIQKELEKEKERQEAERKAREARQQEEDEAA